MSTEGTFMLPNLSVGFQAAFDLSPDGILMTDGTYRVLHVNNAFARLVMKGADTFCGLAIDEVENELKLHGDPREAWPQLGDLLSSSHSIRSRPSSSAHTAGALMERRRHMRQKIFLAKPAPKVLERMSCTMPEGGRLFYYRDITREYQVTLTKDKFIAAAAHELRNPLATIVGFSEILKNSTILSEEAIEYSSLIHHQAVEVARLVDELLDLVRMESQSGRSFTLEPHSIAQFVSQFVEVTVRDARFSRLSLTSNCPDFVVVDLDHDKLTQALRNIVSNAAKYSEKDGPIGISLELARTGDYQYVSIQVADQGIGIAPEDLPHIFEPFFRASTSRHISGTGLGLSLVDEIVRSHRGVINVRSTLGSGTCMEIRLPLSKKA